MSKISIGSGILIVFMGMLIFLDNVSVLNDYFGFANSVDSTTDGNITGVFGFGVAFLGGILSFVSPCVLPLVPIYLSHLAGVGAEEALLLQQEAGGPPALDGLS